jgi:hypothetical protein
MPDLRASVRAGLAVTGPVQQRLVDIFANRPDGITRGEQ